MQEYTYSSEDLLLYRITVTYQNLPLLDRVFIGIRVSDHPRIHRYYPKSYYNTGPDIFDIIMTEHEAMMIKLGVTCQCEFICPADKIPYL
jgi:hypothetical protein